MAGVRLSFLGAPLIERDGKAVRLERRRGLALLAYLAATGRPHRREALIDLLCGNRERQSAFASFRNCLSGLRGSLGAHSLVVDRTGVCLAPGTWTDIGEFRRLGQHGLRSTGSATAAGVPAAGVPAACRDRLERAVSLVRGSFLDGFTMAGSPSFDEWLIREQETIRIEHARLLARLVELCKASADLEAALEYARSWRALDDLDEAACRSVIALCARLGRRGEALRECERLGAAIASSGTGSARGPETFDMLRALASSDACLPVDEVATVLRRRGCSSCRSPTCPACWKPALARCIRGCGVRRGGAGPEASFTSP